MPHQSARKKFLALSLESTRKSYYPQLLKQLEAAKENEKRLQLLIDSMPALISYIDSDQRYVLVNRQYEKAFRLERDQVIGKKLADIVGRNIYRQILPYVEKALCGEAGHFEMHFDQLDTGYRWYDIHYVPEIGTNQAVNGFYTLILDQTDKKQAQKAHDRLRDRLNQAQKMEALGTLSGGIAHDFNNILSGIFGYAELASAFINDPEKTQAHIGKIVESAQRASALIRQILTFSRQSEIKKQPVPIDIILTEVLQMIRPAVPPVIEIETRILSKPVIMGDSTQIHQVIMNLCTNACHAMEKNGGILLATLDETVDDTEDETALPGNALRKGTGLKKRYARLEISDTGPGIDPDIQEKIFDPYFTTKPTGKGTGLGLALVDGIIKKHHGDIRVDSRPGEGASFRILLPAADRTTGPGQAAM